MRYLFQSAISVAAFTHYYVAMQLYHLATTGCWSWYP